MQLISAQTLTSDIDTVTFSSIPQTFTDLKILYTGRATITGSNWASVTFSTSGGTGSYSSRIILGSGAAVGYDTNQYATLCNGGFTANTFANGEIYISNYTSSNQKPFSIEGVAENNATGSFSGWQVLSGALWTGTGAITGVTLTSTGSPNPKFQTGSSFYLYGISSNTTTQNSDGPYAFGGDTIVQSGGYWYHTFLNCNSFTPQKALTANVLVIGGAGGGGSGGGSNGTAGAGGGAGGIFYATSQSLTANTPYACVVGAGGAGAVTQTAGFKGSDSKFGTLTSGLGGGAGAGFLGYYASVNDGGSGGGAGSGCCGASSINYPGQSIQTSTGGTGYGNAGAYFSGSSAGGGGGAGAAASGRTGGDGLNTWSSWASATGTGVNGYYAGGGGGGADSGGASNGGAGGGGQGGAQSYTTAGTANTGSGGGGASTLFNYGGGGQNGASGGSGIIIVRYAV